MFYRIIAVLWQEFARSFVKSFDPHSSLPEPINRVGLINRQANVRV